MEMRPPRAHIKIGPLAYNDKIALPFENLPLRNLESFFVFKRAGKGRICARVSSAV